MTHPREFMSDILVEIETPAVKQHLIGASNVATVFANKPLLKRLEIHHGYTTHPAFEKEGTQQNTFRLKKGYSASQALEDLFTKYEMVIDCVMSLMIAYHVSILKSMKKFMVRQMAKNVLTGFLAIKL